MAVHNILDNSTTHQNKADKNKSARDATLAHWKKQSKFVQGLTKKETTDQDTQKSEAPWHTETLTWVNKGDPTVLGSKNTPQILEKSS